MYEDEAIHVRGYSLLAEAIHEELFIHEGPIHE